MADSPSDTSKTGPEAADNKPSEPELSRQLRFFTQQVDALAETLPPTRAALVEGLERATGELAKYTEGLKQAAGQRQQPVTIDVLHNLANLVKRVRKALYATKIVPRSFLVSLVSQFDAFLGALIRALFLMKPAILNASERPFTLADLIALGTIENARDQLIEREVETVLRKSHSEQFDWFESKFAIRLREGLGSWPVFVEITERRNLIVHTSGVVSQQYLDVCRRHRCQLESGIERGKELGVSTEYFEQACECVFEIAVKLAHVLWRKVEPGDTESADNSLISVSYDLLVEERYRLASNVLDFATGVLKRFSTDEARRILIINRAQAHKWIGDSEHSRAILAAEDWTATAPRFRLGVAVLNSEFEVAAKIMIETGAQSGVDEGSYRHWPLFREFRTSAAFLRAFETTFGRPFAPTEDKSTAALVAEAQTAIEESSLVPIASASPAAQTSAAAAEPPE